METSEGDAAITDSTDSKSTPVLPSIEDIEEDIKGPKEEEEEIKVTCYFTEYEGPISEFLLIQHDESAEEFYCRRDLYDGVGDFEDEDLSREVRRDYSIVEMPCHGCKKVYHIDELDMFLDPETEDYESYCERCAEELELSREVIS